MLASLRIVPGDKLHDVRIGFDALVKGVRMPELSGVSHFQVDAVSMWWTSKSTGSFALSEPDLSDRYRSVTGGADVVFTRQVHGAAVLEVPLASGASERSSGATTEELHPADALISTPGGPAIAVITADCAPVAVWTDDGVIGVAHAGWRGLVAGVVEATVEAIRDLSARPQSIKAALGPCIGPCCYEFGEDELALVSNVYGGSVRSLTTGGTLALDMRGGVSAALERSGAAFIRHLGGPDDPNRAACTSCGSGWFSWRRNGDPGRQALVVQSRHGRTQ